MKETLSYTILDGATLPQGSIRKAPMGNTFGQIVRSLREQQGIDSQRMLANSAGISNSVISEIEKKESTYVPQDQTVLKLALGFGWEELDPRTQFLIERAKAQKEGRKSIGIIVTG